MGGCVCGEVSACARVVSVRSGRPYQPMRQDTQTHTLLLSRAVGRHLLPRDWASDPRPRHRTLLGDGEGRGERVNVLSLLGQDPVGGVVDIPNRGFELEICICVFT